MSQYKELATITTQYVTWVNLLFEEMKLLQQTGAKKLGKSSGTFTTALQYLGITRILDAFHSLKAIHVLACSHYPQKVPSLNCLMAKDL